MRVFLLLLMLCSAVASAAPRVISLAPSMTEIVLELQAGDLLVGVLDGGERPPELHALPSVGRHGQLNIERLLSLRPDLLLLWPGSVAPAQQDQLRRLGIPTYSAEPQDLDQLIDQIAAIGIRLDRERQALDYARTLRERLREMRDRYRREQPLRVFYQVWDKPLYTLGGRQFVSDALRVCGASNLFDDLDQPAPQVSLESVLLRNPQVILASDQAQLEAWKAWPQVDAVARGQLLVVPDKGLERPSGQMIAATERLCILLDTRVPASR